MMIVQVARRLVGEARLILRHRLAKGASFLAVGQYGAAVLNFVTTVVMARLLGPMDYGLTALVIAYPMLLWSFVGTKSFSVTTRYVASFRAKGEYEQLKAVVKLGYGVDFLVSLIAFILVGVSSWWVSRHFYQQPALAWLMLVYAASFPLFALIGNSWAVLSSWERFRCLAFFEVLHPFLKLVLVMGFLFSGFGVTGAVIGTAIAHGIIGLVMMVVASRLLLREGVGHWWKASWTSLARIKQEITSFLGWNYLLVTLSGLMGQIPMMLLGRFRGPEEAGYYRLATALTTTGSYLESSTGKVIYPVLSARWSRGENLKNSLRRWTLCGGVPASVILLLAILFFPLFIPAVFGQGYSPMIRGAQVMMVAAAVSTVFFWLYPFYYAMGKISLWAKAYSFYTIFILGLGWICIQRWGFVGLAGLLAAGKIVFVLLMVAFAIRKDEKDGSVHCSTRR